MLSVPGNGAVAYRCNMLQKHFVPGKLNVLWVTLHSKILSKFSWKKKGRKIPFPDTHLLRPERQTSATEDMYWSSLCLSPCSSVSSEETAAVKCAVRLRFLSASIAAFWFEFFQRAFVFKVSRFPLKLTLSVSCTDMVVSAVSYVMGVGYVLPMHWRRN